MNLLHVDASILDDRSISRAVTAAIVERLDDQSPDMQIRYRDLAATSPGHLTAAHLGRGDDGTAPPDKAMGTAMLEEFLAADIVVIGAPMYNFTIPSQLKAWLDRILVAGKTFRYTERGSEGLAGGKRVIVAVSRGGLYGTDSPASAFEHVETYLRSVFAFIGIEAVEVIVAEGINIGEEQRRQALAGALNRARQLQVA